MLLELFHFNRRSWCWGQSGENRHLFTALFKREKQGLWVCNTGKSSFKEQDENSGVAKNHLRKSVWQNHRGLDTNQLQGHFRGTKIRISSLRWLLSCQLGGTGTEGGTRVRVLSG